MGLEACAAAAAQCFAEGRVIAAAAGKRIGAFTHCCGKGNEIDPKGPCHIYIYIYIYVYIHDIDMPKKLN